MTFRNQDTQADRTTRSGRRGARKALLTLAVAVAAIAFTPAPVPAAEVRMETAAKETSCTSPGTIWWSELLAPETEKLSEFYASVIGWKTKVVDVDNPAQAPVNPEDRYTVFVSGDSEIAGLMKANHPSASHSGVGWLTYIQVANVDESVAKTQASGGTVLRLPSDTAEGHRIAIVSDPMGNVFGIVTPAKKDPC